MDEDSLKPEALLTDSPNKPEINSVYQANQDLRQEMGGLFSNVSKNNQTLPNLPIKRYLQRPDFTKTAAVEELKNKVSG